ncbi:hypothetical protein B0H11DRAFT_207477 [Mycena galericulata]|nr:hypothetical protein B0H11DRAFT_207477 [Mycena galericulata]
MDSRTLAQKERDRRIARQTEELSPQFWGDDSLQLLYVALAKACVTEDTTPLYTMEDCKSLLSTKTLAPKIIELLQDAHTSGSYQALIDHVLATLTTGSQTGLPDVSWAFIEPQTRITSFAAASTQDREQPSTPAFKSISQTAEEVLRSILPPLQRILAPDWKWEAWKPDDDLRSTNPEIYSWLSELEIPLLHREPNLLLHRLGNFQNDPEMTSRVAAMLKPGAITFLVNTSGSGKTRHTLEALCREWGFYLCSTTEGESFGSTDMMNCISQRLLATEGFTPILPNSGFNDMLVENRKIARDCISQVLLARILVFRQFLNAIIASGRNITEDDKRRWVYVQVFPALLDASGSSDVFDRMARVLNADSRMNSATCGEMMRGLLDDVKKLIIQNFDWKGPPRTTKTLLLYCVLDEAQFAANHLPLAFRSEVNPTISRSVMREMILVLKVLVMAYVGLIISGTGVDKQLVDDQVSSFINKTILYSWTSLTGSFDKKTSPELQEAYIRQYVPPTILAADPEDRLINRIVNWLEGRFRFTAAFLANLLKSDFSNPHQFLNDWVEYHTKFRPTDAADLTSPSRVTTRFSTSPLYEQINFARFNATQGTMTLLTNALYQSLLRTDITLTIENNDHSLVEAGFARYRSIDCTSAYISEPLILLSATLFIDKNGPTDDLWRYIIRHVGTNKGSENNGFENYIAFLMAHTFAKPTPLKDVFIFPKSEAPKWADQPARLVALSRPSDSGRLSAFEYDWPDALVPSGQFGCSFDPVGTLAWMNHRHTIPFCFPDTNMGPDIMFVLQLPNDKFIWVSMQQKYLKSRISNAELLKAVRSTVPAKHWIKKDRTRYAPAKHPNILNDTLDALKNLPGPEGLETPYPLLRVIVVSPPQGGIEELDATNPDGELGATDEEIQGPDLHDGKNHHDPDGHLLCSLNWEYIIPTQEPNNILDSLRKFKTPTRRRITRQKRNRTPAGDGTDGEDETVKKFKVSSSRLGKSTGNGGSKSSGSGRQTAVGGSSGLRGLGKRRLGAGEQPTPGKSGPARRKADLQLPVASSSGLSRTAKSGLGGGGEGGQRQRIDGPVSPISLSSPFYPSSLPATPTTISSPVGAFSPSSYASPPPTTPSFSPPSSPRDMYSPRSPRSTTRGSVRTRPYPRP